MKIINYFRKLEIFLDNKNREINNNFYKIEILIRISILLIILIILSSIKKSKFLELKKDIKYFKQYINKCKKVKILGRNENISENKNPYLSIIIPAYNMEKYIERALLSILNQSFKDFEIIIINDFSNDNTLAIINKLSFYMHKITIIEHKQNLGIFASRVDGVLASNGNYILYVDPDDAILNPDLFQKIFDFNNIYNLDMIEFIVFYEEEGKNIIYIPEDHRLNHFHKFSGKIINQPKLSNLLFLEPKQNNYSDVICRPIWNKIIKKTILLKTINFLGKDIYKNKYFNFAEDTIINIINFQFAKNYSNVNFPGYLYNIRKKSITHGDLGINHDIMISNNFILYLKLFYKYVRFFNKDRNYLFYEIKQFQFYLLQLKKFNIAENIIDLENFLNDILNDNKISKQFEILIKNIINLIIKN